MACYVHDRDSISPVKQEFPVLDYLLWRWHQPQVLAPRQKVIEEGIRYDRCRIGPALAAAGDLSAIPILRMVLPLLLGCG